MSKRDRFTTAREILEALDFSLLWQNVTKKSYGRI